MVLEPRVEFEPIEADALLADGLLGDEKADLGIEAIAIRSEVAGSVAEADDRWHNFRYWAALPGGNDGGTSSRLANAGACPSSRATETMNHPVDCPGERSRVIQGTAPSPG
jgi:hypothetical protein